MIRFHTLGVLDLRDDQRGELANILRQPKRLGLLAYLAIASPRRFHRRDSLLALFWPDLDQDHARAALRRALYFLRAELGAEVIAGRGDDEIGVNPDTLWCDATALDRAMDEGAPDRALSFYRGTLLEGLHVSGAAPEYQEWLDRERNRLRGRAAAGAKMLAARADSEGRLQDAASWTRRMLELAPDDEAALRKLVSLLDQSGDRAGALQAYEDFARRLAQAYELAPTAETRAVIDAVQRGRTAAEEPGSGGTAAHTTIAVLPFAIRGDSRFAYLGQGMVDLLATKLDGAGEVRTVDPRALLRLVQRDSIGADDAFGPEEARSVAQHFGAGHFLLGAIVEAGGRLEATASLYGTSGPAIASVRATAASEAEVFELVDELARQLLGSQRIGTGTRMGRLAALTSHSLEALKAFLTGERALREGRYFDAMERFQAAVNADSSFALAYYRLAAAAAGCALVDLARTMADRGFEHRERLSPHDHLVLRAQRAWLHGAVADAESLYNTITGTYPDDVEAWFHLGDLLFHSNPLRGRSAAEAREPFERVLRLEPDHAAAITHLVRISAMEGRREEMFALTERALRVSPEGDQALAMRALRAYAGDDPVATAAIAGELQRARAITVAVAFADVALYAGNLAGAESLARSFIQVARSPELRALCHIQLAHLALAQAQWKKAEAELGHASSLDATWGLEMRALFACLPFVPMDRAVLEQLRDELIRWNAASVGPSMFLVFAMHNGLHPAIRHYLLGMLEARLGRAEAAAEQADRLDSLSDAGGALVRSFVVELRARIAQLEGRPEQGVALLEGSRPELWFQLTVASPFFSLAARRYLHAELLREAGRPTEAAGWYASIAQRSPYELIYLAPSQQRLAEIAAARGDEAGAERHRRRARDLMASQG